MESVGDRIRKIRGRLSREAFAKKYGIHRNTLERYEKNTRKVPDAFLFQLAECENLSLKWVQTGEGQPFKGQPSFLGKRTSDMSEVLKGSDDRQPFESITLRESNTSDMSELQTPPEKGSWQLFHKVVELQERIASLLEDKAELLLELERAKMDVERRDQRIRDLEKENAQLREARKGTAYPGAGIAGVAG